MVLKLTSLWCDTKLQAVRMVLTWFRAITVVVILCSKCCPSSIKFNSFGRNNFKLMLGCTIHSNNTPKLSHTFYIYKLFSQPVPVLKKKKNVISIWRRCFSNWMQCWLSKLSSPQSPSDILYCNLWSICIFFGILIFPFLPLWPIWLHLAVTPQIPQWYIALHNLIHLYLL